MSVTPVLDRLKKVMRIALVGIRPSDQVILKGYLRVLLRLEADLEWVSANHQDIDLFMINYEFKTAENVQKLIKSKPNTATLYTTRNEADNGYLADDLLVLPLKDLDLLNNWLFAHVRFLSTNNIASNNTSSNTTIHTTLNSNSNNQLHTPANNFVTQTIVSTSHSSQPDSNNFAQTDKPLTNLQPQTTNTSNSNKTTYNLPATINDTKLLSFAQLISRLQQREDTLLAITSPSGTLFGYLQPRQQRLWATSDYLDLDQDWVLSTAEPMTSMPLVSMSPKAEDATDLVQWLWSQAMRHSSKFESLLDDQTPYHINSWVKPMQDREQHDHLKVQGVLEARFVTLAEISRLSQCSTAQVKKTLIGLLIAGVMPDALYQQVIDRLSIPYQSQPLATQIPAAMSSQHAPQITPVTYLATTQPDLPLTPNTSSSATTLSNNTPPSAATNLTSITSNATSQISTNNDTIHPTNLPNTADNENNNSGMKSFLTKLRRRLGL